MLVPVLVLVAVLLVDNGGVWVNAKEREEEEMVLSLCASSLIPRPCSRFCVGVMNEASSGSGAGEGAEGGGVVGGDDAGSAAIGAGTRIEDGGRGRGDEGLGSRSFWWLWNGCLGLLFADLWS